MTYSIDTAYGYGSFERSTFTRQAFPHTISGAVALAFSMVVGGFVLYLHSTAMAPSGVALNANEPPLPAHAFAIVQNTYGTLPPTPAASIAPQSARAAPAGTPAVVVPSKSYAGMLDPTFSAGAAAASLEQSSPLASDFRPLSSTAPSAVAENVEPVSIPMPPLREQIAQSVPLPAPRPAELHVASHRSSVQMAQQDTTPVPASAPPDHPSLLEKLFGMHTNSGPALAYAAPEDGVEPEHRGSVALPLSSDGTAVYDISAHTVYLPDGTRLEAHSGRGAGLDDPRYVSERMQGPTPPDTYELQPREQLFHGVQALRLIPVGNGNLYGRTGLLAHTFMLGPYGESFGCVSFRNYNAFLQAYMRGEVKRLTVVARLN